MALVKTQKTATVLFVCANALLIYTIYQRWDDPLQFFLMGGGVVVVSFFLKRLIDQIVNP